MEGICAGAGRGGGCDREPRCDREGAVQEVGTSVSEVGVAKGTSPVQD